MGILNFFSTKPKQQTKQNKQKQNKNTKTKSIKQIKNNKPKSYLSEFKKDFSWHINLMDEYIQSFKKKGLKQTDIIDCSEWPHKELTLLKLYYRENGYGIKEKDDIMILYWK